MKDAIQLRGIELGMSLWADNNDGKYPLPSAIDVENTTVAEFVRAKDTTANIFSLLIEDGSILEEFCISPLEKNKRITAYEDYEFEAPTAAVDPEKALWDPGFSADFTSGSGGHFSYAHLIPDGERLDMWTATNKSDEAILANRGPEMASVNRAGGQTITHFANPNTNTVLFTGSKTSWSGNITHNDTHVTFANDLYTNGKSVGTSGDHRPLAGTEDHDVLFDDEEGFETNLFLGIFTTAGETKEDYTSIWD